MQTFDRVVLELSSASTAPAITIDHLQQELAEKAQRVLGYGLLADKQAQAMVTQEKARSHETEKIQVLNDLDIQPLNASQVKAYQAEEQRRMNRKSLRTLPLWVQVNILLFKMFEAILPKTISDKGCSRLFYSLLAGGLISLLTLIEHANKLEVAVGLTLLPCILGVVSLLYGGITEIIMEKRSLTIQEWSWIRLTFSECHQRGVEIPEFVLDTAVRVQERLPDAVLKVEIIQATNRALGEPFLVLEGPTDYHLEVWEENRFERMTTRKA